MKYSRFELLVIVFGGGAIVATATASALRSAGWIEVAGQLLLLVVLIGALQWGRKGGFAAGVLAAIVYAALRVPTIAETGTVTPTLAQLLIIRAVVFGALGIVGGEICTRIKYFFAKLEDSGRIDEVTNLYNAAYLGGLLRSHMAQHDRYRTRFSLVLLRLDEEKLPPLAKKRGRRVLREAGKALLGDIRLVDEMGRLETTTLCVILPNTDVAGAQACAARLTKTANRAIGSRGMEPDGTVSVEALGYPEDADTIRSLVPSASEVGV